MSEDPRPCPVPDASPALVAGWKAGANQKPLTPEEAQRAYLLLFGPTPKARNRAA